jgi:hypothetical protein
MSTPNKYNPEIHPVAIRYMARAGLTNQQMADELEISRRTLQSWQNEYAAVHQALTEGKQHVDNLVEESLLARALGMDYEEVVTKQVFPAADVEEPAGSTPDVPPVIERTIRKKKLAPDVTACIFWLKNRRPGTWRDVQDHRFSGKVKGERDKQKKLLRPTLRDPKTLRIANELARAVQNDRHASHN